MMMNMTTKVGGGTVMEAATNAAVTSGMDAIRQSSTLQRSTKVLQPVRRSLRRLPAALLWLFFLAAQGCSLFDRNHADVVVIGGGTSGVSAAIQAGRMGADVILVEQSEWLGGMLTAAGVSATDGNHKMPSGLWGEFREHLYAHYGGPEALATGWVSNTQFEPHVGNRILHRMVGETPGVKVLKGYRLEEVQVENGRVTGVTVVRLGAKRPGGVAAAGQERRHLTADVFIDATEHGDLMAKSGADYSIYMETFSETGEKGAPAQPHPYPQDMTYVAILKEYGPEADMTLPRPEGYDDSDFTCMCREVCDAPPADLIGCDQMLDYGKLPNGKYMINWPNRGNDFYGDDLEADWATRDSLYVRAKQMTLSWVYFLQTRGGYRHLGLADDEFPTDDQLALMPYIRESRRLVGVDRLLLHDIQDPYADPDRPLFKTGIAVGDYPVDHHRKKNPVGKQIEFPAIPSYNVPFGALIPERMDGLIVAEKSISVSNVVNGTTRLQPVVMQIGQAAGMAAALSVQDGIEPRELDVRTLQSALLDAGLWLMPYFDTQPDDWAFEQIQRIGLAGVMRGEGVPYLWANQTWFHPDSLVTRSQYETIIDRLALDAEARQAMRLESSGSDAARLDRPIRVKEILDAMDRTTGGENLRQDTYLPFWTQRSGREDSYVTREELAFLLDTVFDPFTADRVRIGFKPHLAVPAK